jgi:hypothetical protein
MLKDKIEKKIILQNDLKQKKRKLREWRSK